MKYRNFLKTELREYVTSESSLPQGYHVVGHVVLLQIKNEVAVLSKMIAELTLQYEKKAKSIAIKVGGTKGEIREPQYKLFAGDSNTVTTHIESGVKFKLDPLKITFSGGNRAERIRLPDLVDPSETVVDMFACVGQFGLHIASRSGAKVIAIEISPLAHSYLQENIQLNNVTDRMEAILGDCRKVHPIGIADRIVMGYLHSTTEFLPYALETLSKRGGAIHMHLASHPDSIHNVCNTINTISGKYNFTASIEIRKIKYYSPNIIHFVFDIELESI